MTMRKRSLVEMNVVRKIRNSAEEKKGKGEGKKHGHFKTAGISVSDTPGTLFACMFSLRWEEKKKIFLF